jgi:hypothetical protein
MVSGAKVADDSPQSATDTLPAQAEREPAATR